MSILDGELISLTTDDPMGLSDIGETIERALAPMEGRVRRALLLPPDATRAFSGVGPITARCVRILRRFADIDVMPALGTHTPMTADESSRMFGDAVDPAALIVHDWRNDTVRLGDIPGDVVGGVTDGMFDEPIPVEVNRRILDGSYDLILSLGQVVPHEVVGMANYSKNIFVGCGGAEMINRVHLISAAWGIERILGEVNTPIRALLDWAQDRFLTKLPLVYIMTVGAPHGGVNRARGLFIGRNRAAFEDAARLSERINIHWLDKPMRRVVAYMDAADYKTTWVANKAIYRTRTAIGHGGELTVLAPGVARFGESQKTDAIIRKYGFRGTRKTFDLYRISADLRDNAGVAAHLMHASPDDAFTVAYALERMPLADMEAVGFTAVRYRDAVEALFPDGFDSDNPPPDGEYADANGEQFTFLAHPGSGLWKARR